MNSVMYVGMDVDKEKIAIAVLGATESELNRESEIRNEPSAVWKFFTRLKETEKFSPAMRQAVLDLSCIVN